MLFATINTHNNNDCRLLGKILLKLSIEYTERTALLLQLIIDLRGP